MLSAASSKSSSTSRAGMSTWTDRTPGTGVRASVIACSQCSQEISGTLRVTFAMGILLFLVRILACMRIVAANANCRLCLGSVDYEHCRHPGLLMAGHSADDRINPRVGRTEGGLAGFPRIDGYVGSRYAGDGPIVHGCVSIGELHTEDLSSLGDDSGRVEPEIRGRDRDTPRTGELGGTQGDGRGMARVIGESVSCAGLVGTHTCTRAQ